MIKKLKKWVLLGKALLPSRLPQGITEFDVWATSIIEIADFPTLDEDSIKFALATMVMHLGPTTAYKPKMFFIFAVKAGAAKQVASAVFQGIKQRQQAAVTAQRQTGAPCEVLRNSQISCP